MKNLRTIILSAIISGVLIVPSLPATADAKDEKDHHHGRKEFRKDDRDEKSKGRFQGKREAYRGRARNDHRRSVKHHYRHDGRDKHNVRRDNRGHHNKPEIRQDFRDVRAARKEVQESRRELRTDYKELQRDRAELRRDIRNGASKEEIRQGRQEIRSDMKEISSSRRELQQDQAKLEAARQELKNDLRKR